MNISRSNRNAKRRIIEDDSDAEDIAVLETRLKRLVTTNKRKLNRPRDVFNNIKEDVPKLRRSIVTRAIQNYACSTPMPSETQRCFFHAENSLKLSPIRKSQKLEDKHDYEQQVKKENGQRKRLSKQTSRSLVHSPTSDSEQGAEDDRGSRNVTNNSKQTKCPYNTWKSDKNKMTKQGKENTKANDKEMSNIENMQVSTNKESKGNTNDANDDTNNVDPSHFLGVSRSSQKQNPIVICHVSKNDSLRLPLRISHNSNSSKNTVRNQLSPKKLSFPQTDEDIEQENEIIIKRKEDKKDNTEIKQPLENKSKIPILRSQSKSREGNANIYRSELHINECSGSASPENSHSIRNNVEQITNICTPPGSPPKRPLRKKNKRKQIHVSEQVLGSNNKPKIQSPEIITNKCTSINGYLFKDAETSPNYEKSKSGTHIVQNGCSSHKKDSRTTSPDSRANIKILENVLLSRSNDIAKTLVGPDTFNFKPLEKESIPAKVYVERGTSPDSISPLNFKCAAPIDHSTKSSEVYRQKTSRLNMILSSLPSKMNIDSPNTSEQTNSNKKFVKVAHSVNKIIPTCDKIYSGSSKNTGRKFQSEIKLAAERKDFSRYMLSQIFFGKEETDRRRQLIRDNIRDDNSDSDPSVILAELEEERERAGLNNYINVTVPPEFLSSNDDEHEDTHSHNRPGHKPNFMRNANDITRRTTLQRNSRPNVQKKRIPYIQIGKRPFSPESSDVSISDPVILEALFGNCFEDNEEYVDDEDGNSPTTSVTKSPSSDINIEQNQCADKVVASTECYKKLKGTTHQFNRSNILGHTRKTSKPRNSRQKRGSEKKRSSISSLSHTSVMSELVIRESPIKNGNEHQGITHVADEEGKSSIISLTKPPSTNINIEENKCADKEVDASAECNKEVERISNLYNGSNNGCTRTTLQRYSKDKIHNNGKKSFVNLDPTKPNNDKKRRSSSTSLHSMSESDILESPSKYGLEKRQVANEDCKSPTASVIKPPSPDTNIENKSADKEVVASNECNKDICQPSANTIKSVPMKPLMVVVVEKQDLITNINEDKGESTKRTSDKVLRKQSKFRKVQNLNKPENDKETLATLVEDSEISQLQPKDAGSIPDNIQNLQSSDISSDNAREISLPVTKTKTSDGISLSTQQSKPIFKLPKAQVRKAKKKADPDNDDHVSSTTIDSVAPGIRRSARERRPPRRRLCITFASTSKKEINFFNSTCAPIKDDNISIKSNTRKRKSAKKDQEESKNKRLVIKKGESTKERKGQIKEPEEDNLRTEALQSEVPITDNSPSVSKTKKRKKNHVTVDDSNTTDKTSIQSEVPITDYTPSVSKTKKGKKNHVTVDDSNTTDKTSIQSEVPITDYTPSVSKTKKGKKNHVTVDDSNTTDKTSIQESHLTPKKSKMSNKSTKRSPINSPKQDTRSSKNTTNKKDSVSTTSHSIFQSEHHQNDTNVDVHYSHVSDKHFGNDNYVNTNSPSDGVTTEHDEFLVRDLTKQTTTKSTNALKTFMGRITQMEMTCSRNVDNSCAEYSEIDTCLDRDSAKQTAARPSKERENFMDRIKKMKTRYNTNLDSSCTECSEVEFLNSDSAKQTTTKPSKEHENFIKRIEKMRMNYNMDSENSCYNIECSEVDKFLDRNPAKQTATVVPKDYIEQGKSGLNCNSDNGNIDITEADKDSGRSTMLKSNISDEISLRPSKVLRGKINKKYKKADKISKVLSRSISHSKEVEILNGNEPTVGCSTVVKIAKKKPPDSECISLFDKDSIISMRYVQKTKHFKVVSGLMVSDTLRNVKDGGASGYLEIPPGVQKDSHIPTKNALFYFILEGEALIKVHNKSTSVGRLNSFIVPRGIEYSIENTSKELPLILGFVKVFCDKSQ